MRPIHVLLQPELPEGAQAGYYRKPRAADQVHLLRLRLLFDLYNRRLLRTSGADGLMTMWTEHP